MAEFSANNATFSGGGMGVAGTTVAVAGRVSFVRNWAALGGGMSAHSAASDVDVSGDVGFLDNAASESGGAVYMDAATVRMGGHVAVRRNRAGGAGGAMFSDSGTLVARDNVTFVENDASDGGAVAVTGDASTSLGCCVLFASNVAVFDGGAVNHAGACSISKVVFRDNSAGRYG